MNHRKSPPLGKPPPSRPPPWPPKLSVTSNLPSSSSLSIAVQAAAGSSSDVESPDSDDEPDPDADTVDLPLRPPGFCLGWPKISFPVKLSSRFGKLPSTGSEPFSGKSRRLLLKLFTTCCAVWKFIMRKLINWKSTKRYVLRASISCCCSTHSSSCCFRMFSTFISRLQQSDSFSTPLTKPLCHRCCCLLAAFPGQRPGDLFIIECVYWFSFVNPFRYFLGPETRRSFNRFPPIWSELVSHCPTYYSAMERTCSLFSSSVAFILKSESVSSVAFLSIHSPIWIEESLKFSFISIKFEVFSSEIIWNFFILSALIYVMFCVLVCFHLFVSEDSRASEIQMSRFVIVL